MATVAGEVSAVSPLEATDLDFNKDLLSSAVSVRYPDLALALGEVERDLKPDVEVGGVDLALVDHCGPWYSSQCSKISLIS